MVVNVMLHCPKAGCIYCTFFYLFILSSSSLKGTNEKKTSHFLFADMCVTCVFWRAHAGVVVDPIHTGGVVLTVVVLAVVDVDLT